MANVIPYVDQCDSSTTRKEIRSTQVDDVDSVFVKISGKIFGSASLPLHMNSLCFDPSIYGLAQPPLTKPIDNAITNAQDLIHNTETLECFVTLNKYTLLNELEEECDAMEVEGVSEEEGELFNMQQERNHVLETISSLDKNTAMEEFCEELIAKDNGNESTARGDIVVGDNGKVSYLGSCAAADGIEGEEDDAIVPGI